jgi:hypothetical protein
MMFPSITFTRTMVRIIESSLKWLYSYDFFFYLVI